MKTVDRPQSPDRQDNARGAAASVAGKRERRQALLVYALVMALTLGLVQLGKVVGFVQQNLQALIAALFLLLPTELLARRRESFEAHGLSWRPVPRSVLLYLAISAIVLPPYVIAFVPYYRAVCGWSAQNHRALRTVMRQLGLAGLCSRFVGRWSAARLALDWSWARRALEQLLVVALPEEYFFRGYLQTKLERAWPARLKLAGGGIGLALVVSAALFALGHLLVDWNPLRLAVFFPALVFGWLRAAAGSIVAPVLFHASCNLLSSALHRALFR